MATHLIRRIITMSGPAEIVVDTFGDFAEIVTIGGGFLRLELPDDVCALRDALGETLERREHTLFGPLRGWPLPGPSPAQERADRASWIEDVRRRLGLIVMLEAPTVTVARHFTAQQQAALDTFRDFLRAADAAMADKGACIETRRQVIDQLVVGDSAGALAARNAVGRALAVATVEGEGDPAFAAAYADGNLGDHLISAADLGREIWPIADR